VSGAGSPTLRPALKAAAVVAGLAALAAFGALAQPKRIAAPTVEVVAATPAGELSADAARALVPPAPPGPPDLPAAMAAASASGGAAEAPAPPSGTLPDGRVVLNLATEDDLVKLHGIGPGRARAILALRTRLGKFRSVSDLLKVKGFGRKTLARLAPKLLVDAPPGPPA
jgi:competence protein ComEA